MAAALAARMSAVGGVRRSTMAQRQEPEPERMADRGAQGERLTDSQQVYLLLEEPDSSCGARAISYLVLVTILASIIGFILQAEPSLMDSSALGTVEIGSLIIFTVEYFARLAVCDAYGHQTRCEFVKAPANVVDLLAIFPTYLLDMLQSHAGNSAAMKPLRVLRAVRLVRVFRIFKLSKYSSGMGIMLESMTNSARPLCILMFILSIGIIFFSSLVYHAEAVYCPALVDMTASAVKGYQAECAASSSGFSSEGYLCCNEFGSPNDFESIVASFWWSMVTMTTVGYGDKAPKTFLGRAVGCVAMIAGIVLISLPVAIVGNKFQEAYEVMEDRARELRASEREDAGHSASQSPGGRSSMGTVFQTVRFLSKAKMMSDANLQSDGLKPMSDPSMKPLLGKAPRRVDSPWTDPSLKDTDMLREKLRRLEGRRQLSRAAQGQVELTLELLDHLEAVDERLARLKEKDSILDVCLHRDFAALSRACDGPSPAPNSP